MWWSKLPSPKGSGELAVRIFTSWWLLSASDDGDDDDGDDDDAQHLLERRLWYIPVISYSSSCYPSALRL